MIDLLPDPHLLVAFMGASVVLAITPGPGVLFVVARSLAHGPRAGLVSVAGVAAGNLGNAVAAIAGLAALFSVSALAFQVVKLAGAAYLVYLGLRVLAAPPPSPGTAAPPPARLRRLFGDGVVVALFNPKTTLFFAAFLPQFMSPGVAPLPQGLALGVVFVGLAALTDAAYALAAGNLGPRLGLGLRLRQAGRYLGGCTFIGLGLLAAAGARRQGL